MYPNAKGSEELSILATLDPVSQAAGTVATGWVSRHFILKESTKKFVRSILLALAIVATSLAHAAANSYQTRLGWLAALQADTGNWTKVAALGVILGGTGADFTALMTPLNAVQRRGQSTWPGRYIDLRQDYRRL